MAQFIKPQMVRINNSLSIDMLLIKKGSFIMGEGSTTKEVTIDYEFELGKYPIIIAEYMHFAKDTKSHYPEWLEEGSSYHIETGSDDYYKKMDLSDNAPIIGISWHDAKAYCKWLSEKSGKAYRLPTEAEWEYAARAGTTTQWSFGDDEKELDKYAWYSKNSESKTHPVGGKLPNPWGLYDMQGNVWEWCEDWYDKDKDTKVLRGGSWLDDVYDSRCAFRYGYDPASRSSRVGFRLLRALPS